MHTPNFIRVNTFVRMELETMQFGMPLQSHTVKKPAEQLPRTLLCWGAYERAKQQLEQSHQGGGWGMYNGF